MDVVVTNNTDFSSLGELYDTVFFAYGFHDLAAHDRMEELLVDSRADQQIYP